MIFCIINSVKFQYLIVQSTVKKLSLSVIAFTGVPVEIRYDTEQRSFLRNSPLL